MDLLQSAMKYHLGEFGVIFIALTLFLFSFSTFLGILSVSYTHLDVYKRQDIFKKGKWHHLYVQVVIMIEVILFR